MATVLCGELRDETNGEGSVTYIGVKGGVTDLDLKIDFLNLNQVQFSDNLGEFQIGLDSGRWKLLEPVKGRQQGGAKQLDSGQGTEKLVLARTTALGDRLS